MCQDDCLEVAEATVIPDAAFGTDTATKVAVCSQAICWPEFYVLQEAAVAVPFLARVVVILVVVLPLPSTLAVRFAEKLRMLAVVAGCSQATCWVDFEAWVDADVTVDVANLHLVRLQPLASLRNLQPAVAVNQPVAADVAWESARVCGTEWATLVVVLAAKQPVVVVASPCVV